MRRLALITAVVFAAACGHKQPPAATSPTNQPASAAPAREGDHDEKAEHAGKPAGKDDDDDADERAAKK